MFDNIGKKIKNLAFMFCIIGIIFSVMAGASLFAEEDGLRGAIYILAGIAISWIGNFLLCGFGELIENTSRIRYLLEKQDQRESWKNGDID